VFNKKFEAYEVIFKETDGKIVATYDQNGKILSSMERFSNVVLPTKVRNAIYESYPGWNLHKDTYLVSYYVDRDVKKIFKIQLRKDRERKNLKVDVDGNII
ncbi:MAG: nicotinate-nucleotide adenylyltransferase, partial [Bacteroidia bacterium]|nr:nicotinate-nucleotide adenylyltransferase [Bacteroidia bacterium]